MYWKWGCPVAWYLHSIPNLEKRGLCSARLTQASQTTFILSPLLFQQNYHIRTDFHKHTDSNEARYFKDETVPFQHLWGWF